jgi:hypothetical protein
MMDQRMRNDLDNYITGHYGEDQFRQPRKKVERRKTVRAKRPVQQAKQAILCNYPANCPFKLIGDKNKCRCSAKCEWQA